MSLTTGAGGAATSECSWDFGGAATYGSPGGAATKLSGCCQCPMLSQKKGHAMVMQWSCNDTIGIAVLGIAVTGIAVTGIAVTGSAVTSLAGGHPAASTQHRLSAEDESGAVDLDVAA